MKAKQGHSTVTAVDDVLTRVEDDAHLAPTNFPTLGFRESIRSDLRYDSLPELLHKIWQHRVAGVLEAQRAHVVKRLHFRGGDLIYAASTHRGDSLWAYLLRQELMSMELLREVGNERATTNRRFGVLLLERGLMTPAQLNEAIRGQEEHVAWSLFDWDEGEVEFAFRELREENSIQIRLPIQSLILGGIRRARHPERWLERLGSPDTVLQPTASLEQLIELAIGEPENALLGLMDGRRTLQELHRHGPCTAEENARAIYALYVLRLLRPLHE